MEDSRAHKLFRPGVGVTGYAVTCVTVEPAGYASFLQVYVTMRNREPGCVTDFRNNT